MLWRENGHVDFILVYLYSMPQGDVRGNYDPTAGRDTRVAAQNRERTAGIEVSEMQQRMEAEARAQAQKEAAAQDRVNRARFDNRYQADVKAVEPQMQTARAEAMAVAKPAVEANRGFRAPEAQSGMVEVSPLSTQSETARIKENIKPPQPAAKPKGFFGRLFG